jgi:hypothetical protein
VTKKNLYHGRAAMKDSLPEFHKGRPIFCTDEPEDAHWYGFERGTGVPTIFCIGAPLKRPASRNDLLEAINDTNANEEDIKKNSPYEGSNETDYLYVPKVVDMLKRKGFDCYCGLDILTNYEIKITVIFDTELIAECKAFEYYDEKINQWVRVMQNGVLGMTSIKKPFSEVVEKLKEMHLRGEITTEELGRSVMQADSDSESPSVPSKGRKRKRLSVLLDSYDNENATIADIVSQLKIMKMGKRISRAIEEYEKVVQADRFEYGMRSGLSEEAEEALLNILRAEVKINSKEGIE